MENVIMTDFLILKDGTKVEFSDLFAYVSQDVFFTETNFQVAAFLADQMDLSGKVLKQTVINSLFFRSNLTRVWCALIYLINDGELEAAEIHSNHRFAKPLCERFLPNDIEIVQHSPADTSIFPRKDYRRLFLKIGINLVYRLFFRRKSESNTSIRAWVDVSEHIYEQEFDRARVLIYPFILNVPRHIRFIYRCIFQKGFEATLCGLPYKMTDWVRLLRAYRLNQDIEIVRIETDAYQRHADELVKHGLETIYTTDEYDPIGVALYSRLTEHGVKSINTAHGSGVYMPLIEYSKFYVFSQTQMEYYQRHGRVDSYGLRVKQNSSPTFSSNGPDRFQPAFVHIYQPYSPSGFQYENRIQMELIEAGRRIASVAGVPFFIKVHPNQSEASKEPLKPLCDRICNRWTDIVALNPIFLMLNSTSYFELKDRAPVLIYDSKYLFPHIYYGSAVETVSIDTIDEIALSLLDLDAWTKQVEDQNRPSKLL